MKRITLITIIVATGCTSISNLKEVDFGITGLEMEFYPSSPSQNDITIFDHKPEIDKIYRQKKNLQKNNPKLMPLRKK